MNGLDDAIDEIARARDAVESTEVRTKLDSIAESLAEMTDTEAGERTDDEAAFADAEFQGAAPSAENLMELEGDLAELAEQPDDDVRRHLEAARQQLVAYRRRS